MSMQKLEARTVGIPHKLGISRVHKLNTGCTRRKSRHCFRPPPPHFKNASAIAVCRWERHLAGFPLLGVVDRWPATPKRARIAL